MDDQEQTDFITLEALLNQEEVDITNQASEWTEQEALLNQELGVEDLLQEENTATAAWRGEQGEDIDQGQHVGSEMARVEEQEEDDWSQEDLIQLDDLLSQVEEEVDTDMPIERPRDDDQQEVVNQNTAEHNALASAVSLSFSTRLCTWANDMNVPDVYWDAAGHTITITHASTFLLVHGEKSVKLFRSKLFRRRFNYTHSEGPDTVELSHRFLKRDRPDLLPRIVCDPDRYKAYSAASSYDHNIHSVDDLGHQEEVVVDDCEDTASLVKEIEFNLVHSGQHLKAAWEGLGRV